MKYENYFFNLKILIWIPYFTLKNMKIWISIKGLSFINFLKLKNFLATGVSFLFFYD